MQAFATQFSQIDDCWQLPTKWRWLEQFADIGVQQGHCRKSHPLLLDDCMDAGDRAMQEQLPRGSG
ncbi:MAG: hypothetical protein ISR72_10140 [Methylobacter sp.]|nr:hypothetical protein [Methylobacter sp.]